VHDLFRPSFKVAVGLSPDARGLRQIRIAPMSSAHVMIVCSAEREDFLRAPAIISSQH
jgi:hypothetical protein